MAGKRTGKHRGPKNSPEETDAKLKMAEAALADAKQEKIAAVERKTFVDRLLSGWERVHEKNHLAALFTNDYKGTR